MKKDNLIINIGRQKGSGGHYVAEMVAGKLSIPCYDEEAFIKETAKRYKQAEAAVTRQDEKRPAHPYYFAGQSVPAEIFNQQSKLIRELSMQSDCVFVGHCADYVLKDFENTVNIFITAPLGDRIARVARREEISISKAERLIKDTDHERAGYYQFYTQQRWADCQNFHLCIDTSQLGLEESAELIYHFIKHRKKDIEI
ncbi:AAA family ATPase [Eubacterium oxidoreducens]|uniref:Cytidylate kinase n=1 Tax=Eubacterium oxidoreducens TaxID=1732 RepID=A0A1G6B501_EUBOX|nr:cytidylate kinase-like family protein [Eubacterium oxidoreducens]SDB15728.1 Cytidylate kinase [Eubacterium oxidoreducens]